jgi:uncharacterized membrane protein YeaQ/YmgE (transglycosylase-associated protein family)
MAVFFWITLGLLVGAIAKLVAWEDAPASWSPVVLLSSAGAAGGGFLGALLARGSETPGFEPASMLLAIIGAGVLLVPYHLVVTRRATAEQYRVDRRAA